MSNEQQIEQEIQAKGLNAPRITPDLIESRISSEYYFTAENGVVGKEVSDNGPNAVYESSLGLLTFCVLVLENGFMVTGESACASPENFDAEIGKKIARQNAKEKIWPLEGYVLRNKLTEIKNTTKVDDFPSIENAQVFSDADALAQANS